MSSTEQQKFGNWLKPASPGLWGLDIPALAVAGAGLIFGLLLLLKEQFLGAVIVMVIAALVVLLAMVKIDGSTVVSKITDRASLASRNKSGSSFYVTGALSTLPPEDAERLPGALLDVETISGTDGMDRKYTLLHHKSVNQLAVVFGCSPDGAAMQEQITVNQNVAQFGGWLSSLSVEDGLSGATIVMDSASESSAGTCAAIRDDVAPNAPAFAKEVLDHAVGTLPAQSAVLNVYATLVYDAPSLGATDKDVSSAIAEVAGRLPGQSEALKNAGAGSPRPLVEADLARIAQLSYQPMRDQELAMDALHGRQAVRDFKHAGPGFFDDSQGRVVFHDGVASMTLMMTVPPGSHITSRSFDRLFGPNAKFLRKRVIMFYRPVDPGTGAKVVDKLAKTADFRMATRKSRPTSFDKAAKAVAEKTEEELSTGARLSLFSMMVTVTFAPTEKGYRDALNQVKQLMNQLIMPYRFVEHAGSAAFHTTLPFGVLPWRYGNTPLWLGGNSK